MKTAFRKLAFENLWSVEMCQYCLELTRRFQRLVNRAQDKPARRGQLTFPRELFPIQCNLPVLDKRIYRPLSE